MALGSFFAVLFCIMRIIQAWNSMVFQGDPASPLSWPWTSDELTTLFLGPYAEQKHDVKRQTSSIEHQACKNKGIRAQQDATEYTGKTLRYRIAEISSQPKGPVDSLKGLNFLCNSALTYVQAGFGLRGCFRGFFSFQNAIYVSKIALLISFKEHVCVCVFISPRVNKKTTNKL